MNPQPPSDHPQDAAPFTLAGLQSWMQSVITHPGGVAAGIESSAARASSGVEPDSIEDVVVRSRALTSVERLQVYGNAYFARLLECMENSFPCLVAALGTDAFQVLAFEYLQQHPSTSYTLDHLADRFPRFLAESQAEHSAADTSWAGFVAELARLEWNIEKVFDGPGIERDATLTPERLRRISPDRWPAARLVTANCLRLFEFSFPVNAFYSAFRTVDVPGVIPSSQPFPSQPTFVALSRRDYIVRRRELSSPQFELLSRLQAGSAVGAAIRATFKSHPDFQPDDPAEQLFAWFSAWADEKYFVDVTFDTQTNQR